jgi:hypothetical protein
MIISSDDWTGIGNPKKIVPPPEGWPLDKIKNWPIAIAMIPFVILALFPFFVHLWEEYFAR